MIPKPDEAYPHPLLVSGFFDFTNHSNLPYVEYSTPLVPYGVVNFPLNTTFLYPFNGI